ncbi:hypothetical protein [Hymenobacter convexus]|uniref:hypothetical protein n=1 Tax=Hymenobacter sp. CA1UV-4 TaxID=3063782 RepID=UPI0027138301|nr:hypothetical protein [Hymenobacter sp. CA1UV-4]MDO7854439.1 hypothetical protein [Hymenobacter sp. CA1UV-4]
MNPLDWKLALDELPLQLEGYDTSEKVMVILGATHQDIAVAHYNFVDKKWYGADYFGEYGQHLGRLVTYWKYVGPLPPPFPEKYIKALEPDFVSEETPMRVLFAGVDEADKTLHKSLYQAVRDNGMQGVWIRASGTKQKTFYYVDFLASDPLELRAVKQKLDQLDVPYTIAPRQKKP